MLVLLIVSVGVHLALTGLGLWFFGAEGSRTPPFSSESFTVGAINVSVQSLLVVLSSVVLIAALYVFFGRTLYGKALRATALNRVGARLVGIAPNLAGSLTFALAALLCAFSGIYPLRPSTTIPVSSSASRASSVRSRRRSYPPRRRARSSSVSSSPLVVLRADSGVIGTLIIPVLLAAQPSTRHHEGR